jgi:hypothetical protein
MNYDVYIVQGVGPSGNGRGVGGSDAGEEGEEGVGLHFGEEDLVSDGNKFFYYSWRTIFCEADDRILETPILL